MTTWTQLQADVIALTDRTDIADKISRFVAIFEARLRRNLRTVQMEDDLTATIDADNEIAKPEGWLAFRALWPSGYQSAQMTPQSLESVLQSNRLSGMPTMYAVKSASFKFDGSGEVLGVYYKEIPAIETAGSNWLSVSAYDAYVFGTLSEAWDYIGNDAQAEKYLQRSATIIDSIAQSDQRDRHHGPLVARKR